MYVCICVCILNMYLQVLCFNLTSSTKSWFWPFSPGQAWCLTVGIASPEGLLPSMALRWWRTVEPSMGGKGLTKIIKGRDKDDETCGGVYSYWFLQGVPMNMQGPRCHHVCLRNNRTVYPHISVHGGGKTIVAIKFTNIIEEISCWKWSSKFLLVDQRVWE